MANPFQQLGVPADFVRGLEDLKIFKPTRIQEAAIPFLLDRGEDLIAQAQTGTGKTVAFGLPLLTKVDPNSNAVQGLVIAPTRELAKQIGKQLFRFTKYSEKMFTEVLAGGDNIDRQAAALRRPTHLVVATPGRLLDMLRRRALTLNAVQYLVLDEADEMLSMGFRKELAQILEQTAGRRSTWLFSATFPEAVDRLVKECMSGRPHRIQVDKREVVNPDIAHRYAVCPRDEKTTFIARFLRKRAEEKGLIFCRTKAGAITLGQELTGHGLPVDVLQGDMTQKERDKIMRAFKKGRFNYLIATDVAARGIDVEGLTFVLHHQIPDEIESYTHRSGRTARAGRKGMSLSLIDPREGRKVTKLEKTLGLTFREFR